MGFGNELWNECEASMIALFDEKTLLESKGVWQKLIGEHDPKRLIFINYSSAVDLQRQKLQIGRLLL